MPMTLPAGLEPYADRLVRRVVDNVPLFTLAEVKYPAKWAWTPQEWREFLKELDTSDLTVSEWVRKQELHRVDI